MEHILFEVQFCIEISIFNESSEFPTKQNLSKLRLVFLQTRYDGPREGIAVSDFNVFLLFFVFEHLNVG